LFFLITAMLWLGLEPSLLPRMHERYFFPADMLAFLFACLVPRAWWIALLFQAGSTLGYLGYLTQSMEHPPALVAYSVHAGALAMIAAMIGVTWLYLPYVRHGMPARVAPG